MVCTSLGSLLRPLFYFLCYIHFSLSVVIICALGQIIAFLLIVQWHCEDRPTQFPKYSCGKKKKELELGGQNVSLSPPFFFSQFNRTGGRGKEAKTPVNIVVC